jgi:hypothetical protein
MFEQRRVYDSRHLHMRTLLTTALATLLVSVGARASADPLACSLTGYKAQPGLTAASADNTLTLTWDGDRNQEVRLRFTVESGTPTIKELAVRRKGGSWAVVAANATPEYRVVSGMRRMSNQQMQPLRGLNVAITNEIIDKHKWDAFWDAPLSLGPVAGGGNPPPADGIANQPGLPRKPEEIKRANAAYKTSSCEVKTNGARIEVSFPGVTLGVFAGRLQYTIYKGANLIRQEIVAKTDEASVAYKYDAGVKGLALQPGSRVAWRDTSNTWQSYQFGGAVNEREMPLKASNRVIIAEQGRAGSIAAFPPPHNFFWAREVATNLGYNWYRKDSETAFSFGIRQAEKEETPQYEQNFALYSARPGTWQRMAIYLYPSADSAQATLDPVLAYTHGDRYKPLPGYQVMNHHYHMDLGQRLIRAGSLDAEIPDLQALKALGINIVSQIDSVGFGDGGRGAAASGEGGRGGRGGPGGGRGEGAGGRGEQGAGRGGGRGDQLATTAASVEGARRHSDKDFLVMADQEFYGSPLGGHTDLLFSHPVMWTQGRAAGQPLVENDPKYGQVYHIGGADDLMEMARREDVLISMPHPRTKGSTGFPDAVKNDPPFKDPHYQGVGFRWGMGVDLSEQRLCEIRCLPLFDDMSNWVADQAIPPKYLLSISEVRYQSPGDDIYASSPVSYVKLDALPSAKDPSPVIKALMRGDYVVTSGEVLISGYAVEGSGDKRTIAAEVEWTFPLEFVEVVWGDGQKTDRQIISAADLPPMGKHKFQIPFDASGKKWVRFAAWDSAGNGGLTQPVKLSSATRSTAGR